MKKLSLAFVLVFGLSFNQAEAQFEGKIQFNDYKITSGDRVQDDDSFTLYITADRILLQGDQKYDVQGSLKAEGILVRQKEQDFVLLTGDNSAMSITREGITSFMNMFGGSASKATNSTETISVEQTNESKTIGGYSATKFIITDSKTPDQHSEVWMTQDVDINWGMLASSWETSLLGFGDTDLPFDLILEQGFFPLQWEQYKGDTLTDVMEAEITNTDIARSKVQVESDVKIMSLQDYLFQQMRNNN